MDQLAWITGAKGLIGNELIRAAPTYAQGINPRGLSRDVVDLLHSSEIKNLALRDRPSCVIHCAALSKNPACDANPALAREVNVEATRRLLDTASDIPFIFFSTDLVFDGTKGNYIEEDSPNPLSVYAETKVEAEQLVRSHPHHLILRISLTGGASLTGNRAFNEEMKNAWRAGESLRLFTDEYRCPSVAPVIARAVWELLPQEARGTLHLCFSERLSRYEIGLALAAKHPELNPKIVASSRREYKGPPRPADTSMNNAKVQELLSFKLPAFTEWLGADNSGF